MRGIRGWMYGAAFLALSALDAVTTWIGARRGFIEANPVVASRISDPALFFGSFALFTALGLLVVFVSSYMSRFSRAFEYSISIFVLMRALPVFNNAYILTGKSTLFLLLLAGLIIGCYARISGKLLFFPTKGRVWDIFEKAL